MNSAVERNQEDDEDEDGKFESKIFLMNLAALTNLMNTSSSVYNNNNYKNYKINVLNSINYNINHNNNKKTHASEKIKSTKCPKPLPRRLCNVNEDERELVVGERELVVGEREWVENEDNFGDNVESLMESEGEMSRMESDGVLEVSSGCSSIEGEGRCEGVGSKWEEVGGKLEGVGGGLPRQLDTCMYVLKHFPPSHKLMLVDNDNNSLKARICDENDDDTMKMSDNTDDVMCGRHDDGGADESDWEISSEDHLISRDVDGGVDGNGNVDSVAFGSHCSGMQEESRATDPLDMHASSSDFLHLKRTLIQSNQNNQEKLKIFGRHKHVHFVEGQEESLAPKTFPRLRLCQHIQKCLKEWNSSQELNHHTQANKQPQQQKLESTNPLQQKQESQQQQQQKSDEQESQQEVDCVCNSWEAENLLRIQKYLCEVEGHLMLQLKKQVKKDKRKVNTKRRNEEKNEGRSKRMIEEKNERRSERMIEENNERMNKENIERRNERKKEELLGGGSGEKWVGGSQGLLKACCIRKQLDSVSQLLTNYFNVPLLSAPHQPPNPHHSPFLHHLPTHHHSSIHHHSSFLQLSPATHHFPNILKTESSQQNHKLYDEEKDEEEIEQVTTIVQGKTPTTKHFQPQQHLQQQKLSQQQQHSQIKYQHLQQQQPNLQQHLQEQHSFQQQQHKLFQQPQQPQQRPPQHSKSQQQQHSFKLEDNFSSVNFNLESKITFSEPFLFEKCPQQQQTQHLLSKIPKILRPRQQSKHQLLHKQLINNLHPKQQQQQQQNDEVYNDDWLDGAVALHFCKSEQEKLGKLLRLTSHTSDQQQNILPMVQSQSTLHSCKLEQKRLKKLIKKASQSSPHPPHNPHSSPQHSPHQSLHTSLHHSSQPLPPSPTLLHKNNLSFRNVSPSFPPLISPHHPPQKQPDKQQEDQKQQGIQEPNKLPPQPNNKLQHKVRTLQAHKKVKKFKATKPKGQGLTDKKEEAEEIPESYLMQQRLFQEEARRRKQERLHQKQQQELKQQLLSLEMQQNHKYEQLELQQQKQFEELKRLKNRKKRPSIQAVLSKPILKKQSCKSPVLLYSIISKRAQSLPVSSHSHTNPSSPPHTPPSPPHTPLSQPHTPLSPPHTPLFSPPNTPLSPPHTPLFSPPHTPLSPPHTPLFSPPFIPLYCHTSSPLYDSAVFRDSSLHNSTHLPPHDHTSPTPSIYRTPSPIHHHKSTSLHHHKSSPLYCRTSPSIYLNDSINEIDLTKTPKQSVARNKALNDHEASFPDQDLKEEECSDGGKDSGGSSVCGGGGGGVLLCHPSMHYSKEASVENMYRRVEMSVERNRLDRKRFCKQKSIKTALQLQKFVKKNRNKNDYILTPSNKPSPDLVRLRQREYSLSLTRRSRRCSNPDSICSNPNSNSTLEYKYASNDPLSSQTSQQTFSQPSFKPPLKHHYSLHHTSLRKLNSSPSHEHLSPSDKELTPPYEQKYSLHKVHSPPQQKLHSPINKITKEETSHISFLHPPTAKEESYCGSVASECNLEDSFDERVVPVKNTTGGIICESEEIDLNDDEDDNGRSLEGCRVVKSVRGSDHSHHNFPSITCFPGDCTDAWEALFKKQQNDVIKSVSCTREGDGSVMKMDSVMVVRNGGNGGRENGCCGREWSNLGEDEWINVGEDEERVMKEWRASDHVDFLDDHVSILSDKGLRRMGLSDGLDGRFPHSRESLVQLMKPRKMRKDGGRELRRVVREGDVMCGEGMTVEGRIGREGRLSSLEPLIAASLLKNHMKNQTPNQSLNQTPNPSPNQSFNNSPNQSLRNSPSPSPSYSPINSRNSSPVYSRCHNPSPNNSLTHLPTHSSTHLRSLSPTHSPTHLPKHSRSHSLTHSPTQDLKSPSYLFQNRSCNHESTLSHNQSSIHLSHPTPPQTPGNTHISSSFYDINYDFLDNT